MGVSLFCFVILHHGVLETQRYEAVCGTVDEGGRISYSKLLLILSDAFLFCF